MVVGCLVATQERLQLAHKLKKVRRETYVVVKARKRSRVEEGGGSTFVLLRATRRLLMMVKRSLSKITHNIEFLKHPKIRLKRDTKPR